MTYHEIENLQLSDLYDALVAQGAGCDLIETEDFAQQVYKDLTEDGVGAVLITREDDEDEFENICEILDLDPVANNVKQLWSFSKWNEGATYICFCDEWDIAKR